jgi:hypothetical protein
MSIPLSYDSCLSNAFCKNQPAASYFWHIPVFFTSLQLILLSYWLLRSSDKEPFGIYKSARSFCFPLTVLCLTPFAGHPSINTIPTLYIVTAIESISCVYIVIYSLRHISELMKSQNSIASVHISELTVANEVRQV